MSNLAIQLEAILFVAGQPLDIARLAELTESKASAVKTALAELDESLQGNGLALTEHHSGYRLVTTPAASESVSRYLSDETRSELTKPALETLAIIAYRGPLTKSAIEAIRGVASDIMLRNLLQRGLISEHGHADEPGKPTLYAVSQLFLEEFGLPSLKDLPALAEEPREA